MTLGEEIPPSIWLVIMHGCLVSPPSFLLPLARSRFVPRTVFYPRFWFSFFLLLPLWDFLSSPCLNMGDTQFMGDVFGTCGTRAAEMYVFLYWSERNMVLTSHFVFCQFIDGQSSLLELVPKIATIMTALSSRFPEH